MSKTTTMNGVEGVRTSGQMNAKREENKKLGTRKQGSSESEGMWREAEAYGTHSDSNSHYF